MRRLPLALVSAVAAIAAAEGALRVWPHGSFGPLASPRGPAASYAAASVRDRDIGAGWFDTDPPPLPRRPLPRDLAAVTDALASSPLPDPALTLPDSDTLTRVPSSEMLKAWNSRFVHESVCAGESFFRRFPGFVLAFDPPSGHPYPRFRFLPGITTPAGLVTNDFGWRGPQIPPDKPPRTVRIAFVGASTTVGSHNQPFSYPEFLAPWLNRWAAAQWPGVRFEVINAGREGVSSTDIAAIVKQEIVDVEPDVIVYYEGANQFAFRELITLPPGSDDAATALDRRSPSIPGAAHSVLLGRLEILWRRAGFGAGAETRKPRYHLQWPPGVNEQQPDPDAPDLPLDLPRIVRDLDAIRTAAEGSGARLVLTSFVWMVEPDMVLDPVDHAHFWREINRAHWPASYADIRRLADFQNRVLAAYARTRGVPFIDMAAKFPRDPNLFGDPVHRTPDGDRLHAWLLLQDLVPLLRSELQIGRLPSPDRTPYGPSAPPHVKRIDVACADAGAGFTEFEGVAPRGLSASVPDARVTPGRPVVVETPPWRSAYAAELPIVANEEVAAIRIRLRVTQGRVTAGILSRDRSTWLVSRTVDATPEPVDLVLASDDPARAGFVLIANATDSDGVRSVVEVERVQFLRRATKGGGR